MKRFILTYIFAATLLLLSPSATFAAEITPAEGTYSYGSTSELSPSSDIIVVDESQELAPTGINTSILYAAASSLIVLGMLFLMRAIKQK